MNKILALSFIIVACANDPYEEIRTLAWGEHFVSIDRCIGDGIAYSKKIGTYPYFQSNITGGRHIDDIAKERCTKTFNDNGSATAFYFKLNMQDMYFRGEMFRKLRDDKYKNN